MNRETLHQRLLHLLGSEGLRREGIDLASADGELDLPDWLDHLATAADALPLPEVPPAVSQDLRRIYDIRLTAEAHPAVLVRDTRHTRRLAGVRGGGSAEGWSMIYTSAVADVVLDVWPRSNGTLDVAGHVMAHGDQASAYRVRLAGPANRHTAGDRLGRFRFDELTPGRYEMTMGNGEIAVALTADLAETP